MFRHAFLAACVLTAVACAADQTTTAPTTTAEATTPATQDPQLQSLTGTLRLVVIPPADSVEGALPTLAWDLEVSADTVVRLAGDVIGPVPALDGANVSVTGYYSDGALVVSSYTVNTLTDGGSFNRKP